MSSVQRAATEPVVAVLVEPRLLRDALVRVLSSSGVSVSGTSAVPERCDVLVTSVRDIPPGVADLVIFIDPEDSADIRNVSELLARIRRMPGFEAVEPTA